jgi:hypothetical protein
MTAGIWMPPAVVVGAFVFLWGTTVLDRFLAAPVVLGAPVPAETDEKP